jgi:hypothetical protein
VLDGRRRVAEVPEVAAQRVQRGALRREGAARAREAYMTALLRARRDHSVDGVLRAAVAFGELGDRAVVAQALRIAGQDPRAREQVRAVADRWMSPPLEAGTPISPGGPQP